VDSRTFLAMLAALLVWSAIVGIALWKVYQDKVEPTLLEAKASLDAGPLGFFGRL
jgi:hypothetical protein